MKKNLMIVASHIALLAHASAHPGPVGHTHDDDWPFDLLLIIAAIAAVVCLMKKLTAKKR